MVSVSSGWVHNDGGLQGSDAICVREVPSVFRLRERWDQVLGSTGLLRGDDRGWVV